ncbi:MAG: phosphoribosylanthranilate isomerase [Acetobacteraceae bacterium]
MTIRVKICGITDPAALHAAAEAGADWVGFNFYPPSPRYLKTPEAAALAGSLVGGPARIGLFVDPSDDAVAEVLGAVRLDALQLYASPARIAAIRARFGVPVWHAIGVTRADELPTAMDHCDRLLIEARPPAGATRPGGNAARLDWPMLAGWQAPGEWMLGGGLTPGNVTEAIAASGAVAVDVSSGVERAPGVKDPGLIRGFIAAVRASG